LVLGILGMASFWMLGIGGLLGLLAVLFGYLALAAPAPIAERHRALSIGGVITGALAAGLALALVVFGVVDDDRLDDGIADGECDVEQLLQDPDC
jgi:hypothetical protein